jgi:hypothetical protein
MTWPAVPSMSAPTSGAGQPRASSLVNSGRSASSTPSSSMNAAPTGIAVTAAGSSSFSASAGGAAACTATMGKARSSPLSMSCLNCIVSALARDGSSSRTPTSRLRV